MLMWVLNLDFAAGVTVAEEVTTKGGLSLSRAKMKRLERLQMLRRDDDEIIALIMGLFK